MPENLKSMSRAELLSEIERLLEVVRQQQQQIQAQQDMIERLESQVAQPGERIKQLEEELRAEKKLKGPPKLKASQLNETPAEEETGGEQGKGGRTGKRSKKADFAVDRVEIIQPPVIPAGAKFKLVYEQLSDLGIAIFTGQINRILTEGKETFHQEQPSVLRVGNEDAQQSLETQGLAAQHWATLTVSDQVLATEATAWQTYLSGLGTDPEDQGALTVGDGGTHRRWN